VLKSVEQKETYVWTRNVTEGWSPTAIEGRLVEPRSGQGWKYRQRFTVAAACLLLAGTTDVRSDNASSVIIVFLLAS
jgi:hypothetical protein